MDGQIRTALKKFIRPEVPGTVNKKKITPNERLALEAVKVGYDEYRKTANADNLKLVLDTIQLAEEMGKVRYKNIKLAQVEEIRKQVEQVRAEGIRSVNLETADSFFGKVK